MIKFSQVQQLMRADAVGRGRPTNVRLDSLQVDGLWSGQFGRDKAWLLKGTLNGKPYAAISTYEYPKLWQPLRVPRALSWRGFQTMNDQLARVKLDSDTGRVTLHLPEQGWRHKVPLGSKPHIHKGQDCTRCGNHGWHSYGTLGLDHALERSVFWSGDIPVGDSQPELRADFERVATAYLPVAYGERSPKDFLRDHLDTVTRLTEAGMAHMVFGIQAYSMMGGNHLRKVAPSYEHGRLWGHQLNNAQRRTIQEASRQAAAMFIEAEKLMRQHWRVGDHHLPQIEAHCVAPLFTPNDMRPRKAKREALVREVTRAVGWTTTFDNKTHDEKIVDQTLRYLFLKQGEFPSTAHLIGGNVLWHGKYQPAVALYDAALPPESRVWHVCWSTGQWTGHIMHDSFRAQPGDSIANLSAPIAAAS